MCHYGLRTLHIQELTVHHKNFNLSDFIKKWLFINIFTSARSFFSLCFCAYSFVCLSGVQKTPVRNSKCQLFQAERDLYNTINDEDLIHVGNITDLLYMEGL